VFYNASFSSKLISCISRRIESEVGCGEFCSNESTFVTDDLAQCRCCVSLVTRCAFDVHLAVGTTRRPTKHGYSGIPVHFLSLMWERRASLEKTLSLVSQCATFCCSVMEVARSAILSSVQVYEYCVDSKWPMSWWRAHGKSQGAPDVHQLEYFPLPRSSSYSFSGALFNFQSRWVS